MTMRRKRFYFRQVLIIAFLLCFFSGIKVSAQDTLTLSLNNVINLALMQSPSVRYAQNQNVNYYWRYRNFKTMNMPKLTLYGDLPDYSRTTDAVTQPDGSIRFIPTEIGKVKARLSLSQSIAQTGTNIYASSSVYRIQNYRDQELEFSGEPIVIGIVQPVFAYNWMKWERKTEPYFYEESQKAFVERLEEISYATTVRYFNYLRVKTNHTLAQNNLKNSNTNLQIAKSRKALGRISENDYSRIELSVLTARKALNTARMALKNADFALKSYIGMDQNQPIKLEIPLGMRLFNIDAGIALQEALENRKETPEFKRKLLEAERDLVRAKRSTGFNAQIHGSYGLSNAAPALPGIYENPETSQQFRLTVTVPILDWGRSASAVKLAESKYDLVVYDLNKEREDFERRVIVQVEQFGLLKEQLETSQNADIVAENGYQIAQRKFQNGEISITDLNISLQERERAKRDYIGSLEAYWRAYYNLRILTLYDFVLNRKITYANPLLQDELEKRRYIKEY